MAMPARSLAPFAPERLTAPLHGSVVEGEVQLLESVCLAWGAAQKREFDGSGLDLRRCGLNQFTELFCDFERRWPFTDVWLPTHESSTPHCPRVLRQFLKYDHFLAVRSHQ